MSGPSGIGFSGEAVGEIIPVLDDFRAGGRPQSAQEYREESDARVRFLQFMHCHVFHVFDVFFPGGIAGKGSPAPLE